MLLFAASDAPDRRDGSEPEPPGSEPSGSEASGSEAAGPETHEPVGPSLEATEPETPTPEASAEREHEDVPAAEPPPPASASEGEPAAPERATHETERPDAEATEPEPTAPDTHETVPPAPDVVPPEPLDRVPPSPPSEPARSAADAARPAPSNRSPLQRAVLALLVIAAAALIGYVLSRPSGREADADALVRSIEAAGRLRLQLETDTPSEARRYVREEFGWRVGVPVFEAVPLRGVAIAQTAPAVEVPVFLYADNEGRNVAVFAYSYALLDQVPDRLRLTDADYNELDEGTPFVRRADGNEVVLWRDRDDIYIAVTDLPPEDLTDGFAMAR